MKGLDHIVMTTQPGNGGADRGPSEFEMRRADLVGQIGDVSTTQSCPLRGTVDFMCHSKKVMVRMKGEADKHSR